MTKPLRRTSYVALSVVALMAVTGVGSGGYIWTVAHARRWTGRPDLGFTSCSHCHLHSLDGMPWAQSRPHHAAPAGLAVAPDGKRLYIALDDLNEVVEADLTTRAITRRTIVKGGPFGLALDTTGGRLFVTCRTFDRLVELDTQNLREVESLEVGRSPLAVVFCRTASGDRLVVANAASDDLSVLGLHPLRELARPAAGREPYALAARPDGTAVYVANRLATVARQKVVPASEVTVIEPTRGRVLARQSLESAHLSEGVGFASAPGWVLTPLVKVRNLVPITQVANGWVMASGLAVADRQGRTVQMPLDEANDYFADPAGVAVDAAGQRAYVAAGGADVVSVVDLRKLAAWLNQADDAARAEAINDLTLADEYVLARVPTGRNPRQLALTPDGAKLLVAERLDDGLLVVDTKTLKPTGRIVLGDGGLNDPIRRGERVFTQAAHTFQRQFSCRSCHPDGHADGLSYDFDTSGIGDNFLDNRSLQGVAGTEPFKWSGKNPSLEVQCGPRFARVLMRTDPIQGRDLTDLTTYLKSLPPTHSVRRPGQALSAAEERGRQIFFATATSEGKAIPRARQCQTCHRPPLFTNRLPSDVGTRGPRDPSGVFDTPHLLGIGVSAPYLHDGRAKTLEELWTVYQTNDLHGVTSYMNKRQLNDLVEYLKTL